MDFKANISLGGCSEEDSHQFFFAPQRPVFGLAIYLVKEGKTYKINFSVVSPILMHDSVSVKKILGEIILPNYHFGWTMDHHILALESVKVHCQSKI